MGIVASVVTTAVTTMASYCCCKLSCSALNSCMGAAEGDEEMGVSGQSATLSKGVRIIYSIFLLFGFITAAIMKDGVSGLFGQGYLSAGCKMDSMKDLCYGHTYVYRITFALACFYLLHVVLAFGVSGRWRHKFQSEFWAVKVLAFIGLLILSLFLHNGFLAYYAYFCFAAAAVFITMQILILIDFAYDWNESWDEKDDLAGDESKWGYYLLIATGVLYGGSITLIVFMFHWFTGEGCDRNLAFLIITCICAFIYTAIAIRLEHTSILTSGVVFAYTTAICYSALRSGSSQQCNAFWTNQSSTGLDINIALSAAFAFLSLIYSCLSTSSSQKTFSMDGADSEGGYAFFHFVMMLGSAYMAVVLTGWSLTQTTGEQIGEVLVHSVGAMWFKIVSQWIAIIMFVWTQFAPLVLEDRFS